MFVVVIVFAIITFIIGVVFIFVIF